MVLEYFEMSNSEKILYLEDKIKLNHLSLLNRNLLFNKRKEKVIHLGIEEIAD
jgi:hypothetical protein